MNTTPLVAISEPVMIADTVKKIRSQEKAPPKRGQFYGGISRQPHKIDSFQKPNDWGAGAKRFDWARAPALRQRDSEPSPSNNARQRHPGPTMLTIASPPRLGASPGSARRWPIRNNSGRDAGATGGNGEPPLGVRVEALVPPLHTN